MKRLFWLLLLPLLAGCLTTEIRRQARSENEMRIGKPSSAWEVLDGSGVNVGLVVLFEAGEQLEPVYMVRNVWHQDLGRVDQLGRAFRYVPHAKEAAWVGSGTLVHGVERILKRNSCQLIQVPIELESASINTTGPGRGHKDQFEPLGELGTTSIPASKDQGSPAAHPLLKNQG